MSSVLKCQIWIIILFINVCFGCQQILHEEVNQKHHYSYKIVSHKKEYDKYDKAYDFYLHCNHNDLGLFCVKVTKECYYEYKDGMSIRFKDGFTKGELHQMAMNDRTKEKIRELYKDVTLKTCIFDFGVGFHLLFFGSIIGLGVLSIVYFFGEIDDD